MHNKNSLDTVCAALAYALGIEAPQKAAPANEELVKFIDEAFGKEKADRIFMYNPDAIAEWIYRKYPDFVKTATEMADIEIPFATVMPSVTPVCFATMYTGAQPEVHGIRKYEKPVLKVDTFFDAALRAGKKIALLAQNETSMSKIFLERNLDYFVYATVAETNAKAYELILKDEYDFIVIYNKNYDYVMHRFGPESVEALSELKANARTFGMISELIKKHWTNHNTLLGFAMDHGCHAIDGGCGSHGLDMEEDLNICHQYKVIRKGSVVNAD
jgi:predicted AlkP superfamily pyrophosphatase or phosphodiesterase